MTAVDHTLSQRPAVRDMFADAPKAIGEVVTSDSTLRTDERWSLIRWLGFRAPVCSYVGRDGIARIVQRSGGEVTELLRFEDADCVRVAVTEHAKQSVYHQNSYEYKWFDRRDRCLYTIAGPLLAKPPPDNPVHFGRSAERVWSQHRLARYREELARDGSILFPLHSGRTIVLADGFLELRGFQADPVRLSRDEVESVTLREDKFRITHVDAKWWGRGKFQIEYPSVANAQLFVMMLKQLMRREVA